MPVLNKVFAAVGRFVGAVARPFDMDSVIFGADAAGLVPPAVRQKESLGDRIVSSMLGLRAIEGDDPQAASSVAKTADSPKLIYRSSESFRPPMN